MSIILAELLKVIGYLTVNARQNAALLLTVAADSSSTAEVSLMTTPSS
jgi:hypothetical protein